MSMLISIDNGGTLTDACVIYGAKVFRAKTLTTPHDLTQCFVQVLKEASKRVFGEERLAALLEEVDYIRYSSTQGTNAVVQRKGPRLGLILRKDQDPRSLARNDDERDLFAATVGSRVAHVDPMASEEAFESHLTTVINELMAAGANRIVVSLGGKTLAADESKVKRIALQTCPRLLLGAGPSRTWSSLLKDLLEPIAYSQVKNHGRAKVGPDGNTWTDGDTSKPWIGGVPFMMELIPEAIVFSAEPTGYPRAPVGRKEVYVDARNMMLPSQVTYDRRGAIWKQFEPGFGQYKNDKAAVNDAKGRPDWSWIYCHTHDIQSGRMTRFRHEKSVTAGSKSKYATEGEDVYTKFLTTSAMARLGT
ncbi:MAG: hydantoinase/oxoprolinase N-terminal domain-containing protein [Panacagrimonas sp.]